MPFFKSFQDNLLQVNLNTFQKSVNNFEIANNRLP